MNFHLIPGGAFQMGTEDGAANEGPRHEVRIRPFLMAETAVTQRQWDEAPALPSSAPQAPSNPVTRIARKVTQRFAPLPKEEEALQDKRLFDQAETPIHGLSHSLIQKWLARRSPTVRLPSEAEWEFACRAGTISDYFWGQAPIENYCWFSDNSLEHPHEAFRGEDACNGFGLQNMLGNTLECVADDYTIDYQKTPVNGDPALDPSSDWSVARGGSWTDSPENCRSFTRRRIQKSERAYFLGLRLAVDVSDWLMSR